MPVPLHIKRHLIYPKRHLIGGKMRTILHRMDHRGQMIPVHYMAKGGKSMFIPYRGHGPAVRQMGSGVHHSSHKYSHDLIMNALQPVKAPARGHTLLPTFGGSRKPRMSRQSKKGGNFLSLFGI